MFLEDNGLLPFLEDWRFFAEPKIQSNTAVVFPPNIIFYLYDIYPISEIQLAVYHQCCVLPSASWAIDSGARGIIVKYSILISIIFATHKY